MITTIMSQLTFTHVTAAVWAARAYALQTGLAVRVYRRGSEFFLSHFTQDDAELVDRYTAQTAREAMSD